MNQLYSRLKNHDWTLLVSLPRNDIELAQAALRGGAQGLKVHVNVEHFASGTKFGSFAQEQEILAAICELARQYEASVGVVPGTSTNFATPTDFEGLATLGIDYFDAYPMDCPAWAIAQSHLDVMMAAFHGGDFAQFATFEKLGVKLCEASILSHDDYGKALSAHDLMLYSSLVNQLSVPVIVPSQKKVEPKDLPALRSTGARGLLIGAIVTGREVESLEAATRAFADAAG